MLSCWAWVDWVHANIDDFVKKNRRIIQLARRLRDPEAEASAHHALQGFLVREGRTTEASEHIREMLRIAGQVGSRRLEEMARLDEAASEARRGRRDRARDLLTRLPESPGGLWNRFEVEYTTGHFDLGRVFLERLVEVARGAPAASFEVSTAVRNIGLAAYLSGRLEHEDTAASLADRLLAANTNPSFAFMVRGGLAMLAAARGDAAAAVALREAILEVARDGHDELFPESRSLLGLIARTTGNLEEAAEHFAFARKWLALYRPLCAWACFELGQSLLERSLAEARALLEEALGVARELDMPPLEERASATLAEVPATAATSTSARPAGMSDREVEVLRLMAAGKNNKEIAFALFISEKTVHNHVSNILAKIGVTNRVEAAAFALRQGLT